MAAPTVIARSKATWRSMPGPPLGAMPIERHGLPRRLTPPRSDEVRKSSHRSNQALRLPVATGFLRGFTGAPGALRFDDPDAIFSMPKATLRTLTFFSS